MNEPPARLEAFKEIDRALVAAARPVKVLSRLDWPQEAEEVFLRSVRAGRPALPKVAANPPDHRQDIERLDAIMGRCDKGHPIGRLLFKTARSYALAARMVQGMGTEAFTRHSVALYGRPDAPYATQTVTLLDAAEQFLAVTDELLGSYRIPPAVFDIPSKRFAQRLRKSLKGFFVHDPVEVVLDPGMASKATAGSKRIRLRDGILFSELDLNQLLHHEAYVHTATSLNGRRQANLQCLGLGAPRTTRTQEGIATLAELATLSIDINRLRRLALRVRAVKAALDGADFIDVFRLFVDAGQSEEDGFRSAQRIFRGGDVRGRIVFTKDAAYLGGLLEVHTFLRLAIRENRPAYVHNLFAGRLTLADVVLLAPYFESGFLSQPTYVPPWAADLRCLAALLTYSGFVGRVALERIELDRYTAAQDSAEDTPL